MRKLFVLLLCAMVIGGTAAHASVPQDWLERTEPAHDNRMLQPGTELTVGTSTAMSGFFSTNLWGMNTADLDVRALLHGYQTVAWAEGRPWLNGTVLKNISEFPVADGAQVFMMEIAEGLTYNDGTPITAQDYVFSLLLEASSAVEALGGASRDLSYIPGFAAYHAGEKELITGVYLISPMEFAIEIERDALLDFYGPELLMVTPYPIGLIAPGYEVRDEGEGAFLAMDGVRSGLTTELLYTTLFNPTDGYVRYPRVTSGPYMLTGFDSANERVSFAVNPYFAGDAWGYSPVIETLHYVRVSEADAAHKLASGEIGLLNKALSPAVVAACGGLPGISQSIYPRTGLAYLAFATEKGPVGDQNVRRAVAMSLDRDALVRGKPSLARVHGYYGLGQWMADEAASVTPDLLPSLDVPFDPEGANILLNTTQWRLGEDGGAFAGNGKTRYRDMGGALEPLRLVFARSSQSGIADDVEAMLAEGLARAGVELQVLNLSFDDLLAQFYHQQERKADLYFLGSDFPAAFNLLDVFSEGMGIHGHRDATSLRDPVLQENAEAMLYAGFENRAGYMQAWLAFQRRFMDVLPSVPLYSGMYHDFYVNNLTGYDVAAWGGWAQAVVRTQFVINE